MVSLLVTSITIFSKGGSRSNEELAFSLQIITDVIVFFALALRLFSEINNYMTSSQRMVTYTQLESEDEIVKPIDSTLKQWPEQGRI